MLKKKEKEFFFIFRYSIERSTEKTVADTGDISLEDVDAIVSIMAQGANLRRSASTTQIAVPRARASTMAVRPHPPSSATATLAGSDRVVQKVSFDGH